eukprot:6210946-Pleurochrysis_carterae.AAC.1
MVQELERVELELRRRERAELEALRAQLALALRSKGISDAPHGGATQHIPAHAEGARRPERPRRLELCALLSVMLNVAALSAAIAIGAMQFIDAGATAKPVAAPLLCFAARRAAQLFRVARVPPTLRHDRRSQAN